MFVYRHIPPRAGISVGRSRTPPSRAAYNRTKFIKERRAMMQAGADYLDVLRIGGNVIPMTRPAT